MLGGECTYLITSEICSIHLMRVYRSHGMCWRLNYIIISRKDIIKSVL